MLGQVRLSALTPPTVSRFKSDLQAAGKGAPTVRYCLAVLSAICRDAVERGQMAHNPVAAIKMPTAPRQRAIRAIGPPGRGEAAQVDAHRHGHAAGQRPGLCGAAP